MTNNSGSNSGYADYTSLNIITRQGDTVLVNLIPGFAGGSFTEFWNIWADFNQDGQFNNDEELLFSDSGSAGITGQLVIPSNIPLGDYYLRVAMQYNQSPISCGVFQYGEVEDYTLTINPAATCTVGTVCNDGNDCTTNDIIDSNCECTGTIEDSDNDGVCDAEDTCPGGDDNIDLNNNGIGDACEGCPAMNLTDAIINYDPSEDSGTFEVQDQGATVFLTGNAWKAIPINYNITSNTVIKFDFKSINEGEIHELSFDNDLSAAPNYRVVLYGSQGIAGNFQVVQLTTTKDNGQGKTTQ